MSEPYDPNQTSWTGTGQGYDGPPPTPPYGTTPLVAPPSGPQSFPNPQYPGAPMPTQQFPGQPYPGGQYPAGQYPAGQYPAGQYPAGQYPAGQYPAAQFSEARFPGAGYAPPYGAPGYSIYPDPGAARRGRPGQVLATAVLGYVEAGFLILTGLILFSGSSAVSSASSSSDLNDHSWGTQFAVAGLGDLITAGLLIAGGVVFSNGKRLGRTLTAAGLAVCVVEALFWIVRLSDSSGAVIPWAVFYLVMPVIATSLAFAGQVSRWLDVVSPRAVNPPG